MRVHVQNHPVADPFSVTEAQVAAASARAEIPLASVTFATSPTEFARCIANSDILIAAPGTILPLLPMPPHALGIVFTLAAGLDRLMPFDWLPPDVVVWNNRGAHGAKAGEFGLMAIMMLAARIPEFAAAQREHQWTPLHTPPLLGRRLTVVGLGDLGSAVVRRAHSFGMRITGVSRSGSDHANCERVVPATEIDEVLPTSEFTLLACPLTPETRGLMSRARLARLPKGACVVNIGRGALLDQPALCDLLHRGHLGGALLDVTEPEPPSPDDPLWSAPNLMLTPHVSADDPLTYNAASLDIFFANLKAHRAGQEPPNRVDRARGY